MYAPRSRTGTAAFAAAIVMGAGVMLALRHDRGSDAERLPVISHVPASTVARLDALWHALPDVARVGGFDMAGGRLYVLDPLSHRVLILDPSDQGWSVRSGFGRRGSGPGEFETPHSLAVRPDGAVIAVTDGARLHFFTGVGAYIRSAQIATSCTLLRPQVAAVSRGFFVSGTCARGARADTLVATLHWTLEGESWTQVAEDIRLTRDGRIGSFFSGTEGLTIGSRHHLFGTGAAPCIHRITVADTVPVAERQCDLARQLFEADPPPELAARLKGEQARRPGYAHAFAWPRHLPVYWDRVIVEDADVLLRPFAADSVVLRAVGSETDLLVAPLNSLVGCRRDGCLWERPTASGVDVSVLLTADVTRLLARRDDP